MEKKSESKTGLIISTVLIIIIAGLVIYYMKPWQTSKPVEETVSEVVVEETTTTVEEPTTTVEEPTAE